MSEAASGRTLIVQQAALDGMEQSLRDATTNITDFLTQLTDTVDAQTAGWTEGTPSRIAQRAHEQKIADGVEELKAALASLADEVDVHRERCREIEVENVAIVG